MRYSLFGEDQGRGNIVGIQPYLDASHYQSPGALRNQIGEYLQAASDKGWLAQGTLVLLPEHIGTWLVASDQPGWIYSLKTTDTALSFLLVRYLFPFLDYFSGEEAEDAVAASIFKMRSAYMAERYQAIFESLASEFKVTLVAGSIALQNPIVADGQLIIRDGPVYNTTAIFTADGIESSLVKKVFPIADEQGFTQAARVEQLAEFSSSSGPFSVLICADSWFDESYDQVTRSHNNIVLVPSFLTGSWTIPWRGYSGYDNPADIDLGDVGTITEGEAWLKYAVAGKAKKWDINYAMNVFCAAICGIWKMKVRQLSGIGTSAC